MILLILVDCDPTQLANYLLVDFDQLCLEQLRNWLALYKSCLARETALLRMHFQLDAASPAVHAYTTSPAEVKSLAGVPSYAGLSEVVTRLDAEPLEIAEIELVLGEEGVWWQARYPGDGDAEVVSAPIPFPILEKILADR